MHDDEDQPIFEVVGHPEDTPLRVGPADSPRSRRPLNRRWIAVGAALAAVAVLAVVLRPQSSEPGSGLPNARPTPTATPSAPSSTPRTSTSATPTSPASAETTAPPTASTDSADPALVDNGPCGYQVDPLKITAPLISEPTGLTVVLGAGIRVDLDTGLMSTPLVDLADNEQVQQMLVFEGDTYLLISSCTEQTADSQRLIKVGADGAVSPVRVPLGQGEMVSSMSAVQGRIQLLLSDENWSTVGLQPLVGGKLLALPEDLSVWHVGPDRVIGSLMRKDGSGEEFVAVETTTGKVSTLSGTDQAAGQYPMFMDDQRAITMGLDQQVTIHHFDTDKDEQPGWKVPESFSGVQAVSEDGNLAFGFVFQDASGTADGTSEVMLGDYGLLDLRTGTFTVIPGLRGVNVYSSLNVRFTGPDNRLVLTAVKDDGLHLFTYRPGDRTLAQSPRVLPDLMSRGFWQMEVLTTENTAKPAEG